MVSVKGKETFRIPAINIEAIVTFGYMGASPGVMKLCADSGISLLSPNGRFVSRVQGQLQGNVLLRKAQYALADDEARSLHVARLMIAAKIQNYRWHPPPFRPRLVGQHPDVEAAAKSLDIDKREALFAADKAGLLGFEGHASNIYFAVLPQLILSGREAFPFNGRNRRPPRFRPSMRCSRSHTH